VSDVLPLCVRPERLERRYAVVSTQYAIRKM